MRRRGLRALARLWGACPAERLKLWLLARLGPRFLVSVWAVVVAADGRVLLFRHTHDRVHPWGLPSGRLGAHESPEAALRREFTEEVGGELRPLALVAALCEPNLPALRLVYRCALVVPPCAPSVEVDGWAYFAPTALPASVRPLQRVAITQALTVTAGHAAGEARSSLTEPEVYR